MSSRLLCSIAAATALVAIAGADDGVLTGRMENDVYVSPTGQFKIPAPVLTELGGTITDSDSVVTFQDNYDTHLSIACFEMDAAQKWELDTLGLRDYLLHFFTNFVLTNFQARFPKSTIESARFMPDLLDGTMITFALLPGGSSFESRNRIVDDQPQTPVVAKRGTLLFVRNRHVYVVSSELAERATQRSTYNRTVEQENLLLTERLTTLAGRFIFADNKSRTP